MLRASLLLAIIACAIIVLICGVPLAAGYLAVTLSGAWDPAAAVLVLVMSATLILIGTYCFADILWSSAV